MNKLKLYTFTDDISRTLLFYYRTICFANNKEEAFKIFKKHTHTPNKEKIKSIPITKGLFLDSGGNG